MRTVSDAARRAATTYTDLAREAASAHAELEPHTHFLLDSPELFKPGVPTKATHHLNAWRLWGWAVGLTLGTLTTAIMWPLTTDPGAPPPLFIGAIVGMVAGAVTGIVLESMRDNRTFPLSLPLAEHAWEVNTAGRDLVNQQATTATTTALGEALERAQEQIRALAYEHWTLSQQVSEVSTGVLAVPAQLRDARMATQNARLTTIKGKLVDITAASLAAIWAVRDFPGADQAPAPGTDGDDPAGALYQVLLAALPS